LAEKTTLNQAFARASSVQFCRLIEPLNDTIALGAAARREPVRTIDGQLQGSIRIPKEFQAFRDVFEFSRIIDFPAAS
jgi:hypothetical protein